jgi:hypothetical protein
MGHINVRFRSANRRDSKANFLLRIAKMTDIKKTFYRVGKVACNLKRRRKIDGEISLKRKGERIEALVLFTFRPLPFTSLPIYD